MTRLLAAAVLALGVLLVALTDQANADHATLTGTVTLNGKPAPGNVQISARSTEGMECGTFATAEGGSYEFAVSEDCKAETSVLFVLAKTGDQAPSAATIEGGEQAANVAFEGLSAESLQALGVEEATPPPVVQVPSAPLSGADLWVVIVGAVALPLALLFAMVLKTPIFGTTRDRNRKNGNASSPFRSQIEGMVLVMVVLAVILLGVTDKIGSDGLVSVLAAIVGYTLGREVGRGPAGPTSTGPMPGTVGLSPSGADFGVHPPGQPSDPRDFTVANQTGETIQVTAVTLEGDPGFEVTEAAPDESRRWWIGNTLDLAPWEELVIRTVWIPPEDAEAGSIANSTLLVSHTAPGAAPTARLTGKVGAGVREAVAPRVEEAGAAEEESAAGRKAK